MYLFIDTETTGLPKRSYTAPMNDFDNWPRVVQIAYLLCDEAGEIIESCTDIIRCDDYDIPAASTEIHGITTGFAYANGVPFGEAMTKLRKAGRQAQYAIAHNMNFDYSVIGCECKRHHTSSGLEKLKKSCTMRLTTEYCALNYNEYHKTYKFPKLSELHEKIFGLPHEEEHSAMGDVIACKNCFFKLIRENVLMIPKSGEIIQNKEMIDNVRMDAEREERSRLNARISEWANTRNPQPEPVTRISTTPKEDDNFGLIIGVIIAVVLLMILMARGCK